jgi:hypothetical protein
MSQVYGSEAPRPHRDTDHRPSARWLVAIQAGDTRVARLYLEDRTPVAEFDAGAEEVAALISSLLPTPGATGPEWDRALAGHSPQERADAAVYRLEP